MKKPEFKSICPKSKIDLCGWNSAFREWDAYHEASKKEMIEEIIRRIKQLSIVWPGLDCVQYAYNYCINKIRETSGIKEEKEDSNEKA